MTGGRGGEERTGGAGTGRAGEERGGEMRGGYGGSATGCNPVPSQRVMDGTGTRKPCCTGRRPDRTI